MIRDLRILHLVNEGLAGGVLRVAMKESKYLNRSGVQSEILLPFMVKAPKGFFSDGLEAKMRFITNNPMPRILQDYTNPLLGDLFGIVLGNGKRASKMIKSFEPDWIMLHNLSLSSLAIGARKMLGVKTAVYIHNPLMTPAVTNSFRNSFPQSARKSKLDECKAVSKILSKIDVVLTSSNVMKKFTQEYYGVDAHIVPPGCEPLTREILESENKLNFVLVPQRVSLGKGIIDIIRIIDDAKVHIPVVLAGAKHYSTSSVVKKLKNMELKFNCDMLLDVDEGTLTKLYMKASFIVSISREPFGMYIIEAASKGTTMVSPMLAGATELFRPEIDGLFYSSYAEAVEQITRLVNDPQLATRMGFNAWSHCVNQLTWEHHVKRLIDVLTNGCS